MRKIDLGINIVDARRNAVDRSGWRRFINYLLLAGADSSFNRWHEAITTRSHAVSSKLI